MNIKNFLLLIKYSSSTADKIVLGLIKVHLQFKKYNKLNRKITI